MVVELQILSKVINTGNFSIIEDNLLTEDYFAGSGLEDDGYKKEFNFIVNHYKQYHQVPDKATFLGKFPDIELYQVDESDEYLIDAIREQYLFVKSAPVVQNIARLLKTDANAAIDYMLKATKELTPDYRIGGTDIIADAKKRYESYIDMRDNPSEWFFSTGFSELDSVFNGLKRKEEFFVIYARTHQGKSWILEYIASKIWEQGANVGYISPEMTADSVGFRFDTLYKHFSNRDLSWGKADLDSKEYLDYIEELSKNKHKFIVSRPEQFDKKITISKLRKYVKQYCLDALCIDGIKYLSDERYRRGDNLTTSLTNISEDLVELSLELEIPILVVTQSNRSGVMDAETKGTPELESIRDSDGIGQCATKALALRQENEYLQMGVKKNRGGIVGDNFRYLWTINTGEFVYTPDYDAPKSEPERRKERKQKSGKDVF